MIDLHLHSLCSDGEFSPSEVVKKAKQENISVISLTDHDSISGISEASATASKLGIQFIPGVELEASTDISKSRYIHILGYNFSKYNLLEQYLNALKQERITLVKKYISLLNELGYPLTFEDVTTLTPGSHLTVYHIATLLSKKGYFDFSIAKKLFLNPDGKYYIPRHFYNVDFIINLIIQSGGIPVLAHPCRLRQKGNELDRYIAFLSQKGLRGIEVYYSSHSKSEVEFYKFLADKYHLLMTAGSDWHSPKDNIQMGLSIPFEEKLVFQLLNHSDKAN